MTLGAEPKKIVILGALVVIGGYFFYTNVLSEDNGTPPQPAPARKQGALAARNAEIGAAINPAAGPAARGPVVRGSSRSKSSEEFHPSMKRKPEDVLDPTAIDPKIRLDLLAKVQSMELESSGRNPFQFGQPPPPPVPKVTVDPKKLLEAKNQDAKPAEPPKDTGPPKPPPLNLSWKYYGYTSPRGSAQKKAFFLDGEEIFTANEGEVLKRKYRVVRIGVNSVVVEDTDTKSQQTLPLAEEAVG
jgi:hypothetical protein